MKSKVYFIFDISARSGIRFCEKKAEKKPNRLAQCAGRDFHYKKRV